MAGRSTDDREVRRIAVNTGGGDAPGLNAVIRAVTLGALDRGWQVLGISNGYDGLIDDSMFDTDGVVTMTRDRVRDITHLGGTILGTTNRGNPFDADERPATTEPDRPGRTQGDKVVQRLRALEVDRLVAIGGDGSLTIASRLADAGVKVIGVPKTIDNDLEHTDRTTGFDSAVTFATECIDRLISTTAAHRRVMVVEVMGRTTGWIALHAGLAAAAHAVLIPEIPYDLTVVADRIAERERRGHEFSIVVVAEGAHPVGGTTTTIPGSDRLGGVGARVAAELEVLTGKEARALTLGHLLRGGSPSSSDRRLGLRYGAEAVLAIEQGVENVMIALDGDHVRHVPLAQVAGRARVIPLNAGVLRTARAVGLCLGDPAARPPAPSVP
ncbi:MAG: ATP-dependent 6-phosphofructokinase [Microthrixaceae bacterium]